MRSEPYTTYCTARESRRGSVIGGETSSGMRLRFVHASDVDGAPHDIPDGWYTDDDGSRETLQPIVIRLPRSRGFFPGATLGNGMVTYVDTSCIASDASNAARWANALAERMAEEERDYQRAQNETVGARDAYGALHHVACIAPRDASERVARWELDGEPATCARCAEAIA